jgi:DNA-binding NtrC family response regulator
MNAHARQSTVLLIESDIDSSSLCRRLIEDTGAGCHAVASLAQAEDILRHHTPDVVVVDFELEDGSGLDLIALLRQGMQHRNTPILLLTGEIKAHQLERAVMMGIYAFLAKPFSHEEFTKLLNSAIADEAQRVRNSDE